MVNYLKSNRSLISCLTAGVITLILTLSVLSMFLRTYHYDWSLFIQAGDRFWRGIDLPEVNLLPDSHGYDGQFYYFIAKKPWDIKVIARKIDNPIRFSRIGYPLTAFLLSFGGGAQLPKIMVLVNLLAIGGGAILLGQIFEFWGKSGLWGVLFGLIPGFTFSLGRNLIEPLALFWFVSGVMFWLKNKQALASLLFLLAVLTRETLVLGVIGLLGYQLTKTRKVPGILLISLVSFLLWQILVVRLFSPSGIAQALSVNLAPIPFQSAISYYQHGLATWLNSKTSLLEIFYFPLVFGGWFLAVLAGLTLRQNLFSWLCLGMIILVPFYTQSIWVEPWAYTRVTCEFWLALILLSIKLGTKSSLFLGIVLLTLNILARFWLFGRII